MLETARTPGDVVRLPFQWPEPLESVRNELPEPTPIGQLVRKRPWLYLRFLKGDIPDRTGFRRGVRS